MPTEVTREELARRRDLANKAEQEVLFDINELANHLPKADNLAVTNSRRKSNLHIRFSINEDPTATTTATVEGYDDAHFVVNDNIHLKFTTWDEVLDDPNCNPFYTDTYEEWHSDIMQDLLKVARVYTNKNKSPGIPWRPLTEEGKDLQLKDRFVLEYNNFVQFYKKNLKGLFNKFKLRALLIITYRHQA